MVKRSDERIKYFVEFRTVIVLSIGALYNESIRCLKAGLELQVGTALNLWLKRIVVAVLRGSFAL
jgi:hypothetical protein